MHHKEGTESLPYAEGTASKMQSFHSQPAQAPVHLTSKWVFVGLNIEAMEPCLNLPVNKAQSISMEERGENTGPITLFI